MARPKKYPETLRKRLRQAEADSGARPELLSSLEREEIRRLRRENYELRRANEILKSASVFFAWQLHLARGRSVPCRHRLAWRSRLPGCHTATGRSRGPRPVDRLRDRAP